MNNTTPSPAGERTHKHTPGPWATDIEEAEETIQSEGSYDGFETFRTALETIADACSGRARKIAQDALAAEQSDCRIAGSCVYQNDGSGGQGNQVCSLPHDPSDGLDIGDEEYQANARLIAAAPDLLAELKRLELWFSSHGIRAAFGQGVPLKNIRDAISKAL